MTPQSSFLGRYENVDPATNTSKFWECLYLSPTECLIRWGRIGAKNPQKKAFDCYTAETRAREKVREGYRYIPGSHKSLQEIQMAALESAVARPTPTGGRSRM